MQKAVVATYTYSKMNVMTADPLRLIVMMYEGAIRSLEDYKKCFQERDYEAKCKALNRAQEIISELKASLNMETGEIARLLSNLYAYMTKRLLSGDLERHVKAAEEVIKMLSELKEGWEGIEIRTQGAPSPSIAVKNSGDKEAFAARV